MNNQRQIISIDFGVRSKIIVYTFRNRYNCFRLCVPLQKNQRKKYNAFQGQNG